MKKLLLKSILLLCALVVGTNAWADTAIITFASQTSGTSDGSSAYTISNFVSSGIASSSAAFGTITCSATAKCYSGKTGYGLKAGASSNAGSFTLAFSTALTNVSQITLNRASYASDKTTSITVKNGDTTLGSANTPGNTNFSDMDITSLSIASLSGLTVQTGKYCYIKSITITYTPSSTPTCATPTFSPVAGTYTSAKNVTISTTTEGATIHYTTDGSTPTTSSSTYSSEISISTTTTIKAIAVKNGSNNSAVATATYNFVTIEHAGTSEDPYTVADARNAIDATDGTKANVYVTGIVCTGGSDFGSNALNYWISDDGTETNKLEAYRGKNLNNTNFTANTDIKVGEIVTIYGSLTKFNSTYEFTSGNYLVSHKKKPATPTFTPAASTYSSAQNVTISCATDGATIYYTMGDNPATPTSASTPYTGAINVDASTTIKAIAIKEDVSSDVATAEYTINAAPFVTVNTNSIEVSNAGENSTITATYGNLTNFLTDVVFYESNGTDAATYDHSWILTDFDASNNLEYVIDENTENASRTAYLKIYVVGDEGDAYSELITITQASANYATLPFTWAGGTSSALNALTGVTTNGLGSDYNESNAPYRVKMDNSDDYIQIKISEEPKNVRVNIGVKMIGGANASSIKVQESANGTDFTDLESLAISGSTNAIVNLTSTQAFASTTRYIRLLFVKGSNIGVGPISIAIPEPSAPVDNGNNTITITTSDNMAGWRAFYDASQDYEVDGNTKIYVAKAKAATAGEVELTALVNTKIPAGEPVILKTTDAGHSMTLTETSGAETLGANLLAVTDGTNNVDGYRLGYGEIGGSDAVGFFKYATTTAPAAGIVYIDKSNVNTTASARGLSISFADDETTGLNEVKAQKTAGEYFNLAGQRVAQPTKGLYIVNGKKVIIK